jgi:hypothetical protein
MVATAVQGQLAMFNDHCQPAMMRRYEMMRSSLAHPGLKARGQGNPKPTDRKAGAQRQPGYYRNYWSIIISGLQKPGFTGRRPIAPPFMAGRAMMQPP